MKKYVVLIFYENKIYAKFKGHKSMSLRKYLKKSYYVKTTIIIVHHLIERNYNYARPDQSRKRQD